MCLSKIGVPLKANDVATYMGPDLRSCDKYDAG